MSRLLIAVLMACVSGLLLEAQSKPAVNRSHLDGNWQLEAALVPENPKNWQRPIKPASMDSRLAPCIQPSPQRVPSEVSGVLEPCLQQWGPVGNTDPIRTLITYGRTLIAESVKLSVSAGPTAITIGDDFFAPTAFTIGSYRLAVPTIRTVQPSRTHFSTVTVKTRWEGEALVQDLSATSFGDFKLRRVFKLAEDGKRLLMLIHLEKPKIKPPVEDMTRAYVRESK